MQAFRPVSRPPRTRPRQGGPRIRYLALLALLVAPGCGAIRFQHAWAHYRPRATHDDAVEVSPIEGRWKGSWSSEQNGHSGGLRCIVTPQEPGRFEAWFYSTYASLLFFQYRTILATTVQEDGSLRFEGQQDLGSMAGGVYRYLGSVTGDAFRATYQADNGDHGVFEMQRVDAPLDPRP